MSHQQLFRRGTTSQLGSYTPGTTEIVADTTTISLRIGDSSQAGGYPIHKFAAAKTTMDANGVVYASSTTLLTTSTSLTWDGTTFTIGGNLTFTGAQTIQTSTGILSISSDTSINLVGNVIFNEAGSDIDVRVESDTNANAMFLDGGAFSGVGSVAFGSVSEATGRYFYIDPPNLTAAANVTFYKAYISNNGSVTIPAGTTANAATLNLEEPNLVATGTLTRASTFRIGGAPTEATTNFALDVVSGVSYFGGNVGIKTTAPSTLLHVGLAGTTLGTIGIAGNTSGLVTLTVAAAAGTWTMKLPTGVAGTAGFQLTDAAGDGITSWASAASSKDHKNILNQFTDTKNALQKMLEAPVYNFRYKNGMGTGDYDTEYVGIMAEESPWAMHFHNKILNPVSTFGYTVLAIQELNKQIAELKNEIQTSKQSAQN